MLLKSNLRPC